VGAQKRGFPEEAVPGGVITGKNPLPAEGAELRAGKRGMKGKNLLPAEGAELRAGKRGMR